MIGPYRLPSIWELPLVLALWITRRYRPEVVRYWSQSEWERYLDTLPTGLERANQDRDAASILELESYHRFGVAARPSAVTGGTGKKIT